MQLLGVPALRRRGRNISSDTENVESFAGEENRTRLFSYSLPLLDEQLSVVRGMTRRTRIRPYGSPPRLRDPPSVTRTAREVT
ncbi:hypothetical protein, partial [Streptomyces pharetrae]|uniref:hypothetical protein n=1 Tax=Streptomyces pharetrae TaxID=291370 RepID=UPI0036923348